MLVSSIDQTLVLGSDTGRGNLLGVQPYLLPADYASQTAYFDRLDAYLAEAARLGWIGPLTVAVFPEYCAAWLVTAGESARVYWADTILKASAAIAVRHLPGFVRALWTSREADRVTAALFRLKAAAAARTYTIVFSELARKYAITIAAGSLILPAPRVENGAVRQRIDSHTGKTPKPGRGCFIFGSDISLRARQMTSSGVRFGEKCG